jgi:hypothetical protein
MIIVRLQGGLGNQMFQYAAGRFLALRNFSALKFDLSCFENDSPGRQLMLESFNIAIHQATGAEIQCFKKTGINKWIFERMHGKCNTLIDKTSPSFHPEYFALKGNVYLDGYFQSEEYFRQIKEEILSDFTYAKEHPDTVNKLAETIKSVNSVSIHIRRGDYISDPVTNEFHGICTLEYYQRAISVIKQHVDDPQYFIFSDDIEWVNANFNQGSNYKIISGITNTETEDLFLMSSCRHNIIANSSFSWWGAWLNKNPNKIVVAPANWVNRNSRWYNEWNIDDSHIIPGSWIKI